MTTNEAKDYLISNTHFTEDNFTKATEEDVSCELAEKGEWICDYKIGHPINEWETKTAIELAVEHKFWNNPDCVKSYTDFMMGRI